MNNTWKGADGIVRQVKNMTPMHLAMVCKQLETSSTAFNGFKLKDFGSKIINSSLTVDEWMSNIKLIKDGKYQFYDDSPELDEYYTNLVNNYTAFLAPRCLQFKAHFEEWMQNVDGAIYAYNDVGGDPKKAEELTLAKSQTCAENWFAGRFDLIKSISYEKTEPK